MREVRDVVQGWRDRVGGTPLVALRRRPGLPVIRLKLEGSNPSGSIKDRACVAMIQDKLDRDELTPGRTLLTPSSGNFACAVAYYGRLLGHPVTVVTGSKLTAEKRRFIEYLDGSIIQHGQFTIDGDLLCREMVEVEPRRYCFLDQLHDPVNALVHAETTGPEILAAAEDMTMLVGSLGSGGSLYGTATFLKRHRPGLEVVSVQAASGSRVPGMGTFDDGDYETPFIREGYRTGLFGHTFKVSEREALRGCQELVEEGLFCGLQTGGVLHAARLAAAELGLEGSVVVLSGDTGWKNLERLLAMRSSNE